MLKGNKDLADLQSEDEEYTETNAIGFQYTHQDDYDEE